MKRLLIFNEAGDFLDEQIVSADFIPETNQYLADLDEVIAFHRPKLVEGIVVEGKTIHEFEEEELFSALKPSQKEVEQAQFEIRTMTLLMELGII